MLQYWLNRLGKTTLDLKRLFARSMTDGPDFAEQSPTPSPRSAKRRTMFITLAAILAIVGTLAGGYYFAMRPVTLRICSVSLPW